MQRLLLWKAPPSGNWTRGAIVVMHGGGGQHTNFCVANVDSIAAQVRFTAAALASGFAVFLLDSSDRITDSAGRLCGKVWDDEVRARDNLDLPFIEQVLRQEIPARRSPGSRSEVFLTGLSSGGYMTVRAATRLNPLVTAFAPVASGDPYGWHRDCTPLPTDRSNVFGLALDNDTSLQISLSQSCAPLGDAAERTWDNGGAAVRPAWRMFHHENDGIHDLSCVQRVRRQLQAHDYPQVPPFTLTGAARSAALHSWQDEYNAPLLDFFIARLGAP